MDFNVEDNSVFLEKIYRFVDFFSGVRQAVKPESAFIFLAADWWNRKERQY